MGAKIISPHARSQNIDAHLVRAFSRIEKRSRVKGNLVNFFRKIGSGQTRTVR